MPETGRFLSERDQQNQRNADAAYGADPGNLYRVALPDVADVTLPARDEDEAKAKFNKLCGVLRTTNTYSVQLVEERHPPAPQSGQLGEQPIEAPPPAQIEEIAEEGSASVQLPQEE